jgi:hypothetical protein
MPLIKVYLIENVCGERGIGSRPLATAAVKDLAAGRKVA